MLISSTEANTSFVKEMRSLDDRQMNDVNSEDWIHFLQDHRTLLEENSTRIELKEETMMRYRYRIRDYLKEVHGYNRGGFQAFMVVNRLHGDLEFVYELGDILVPSGSYIDKLRKAYKTNLVLIAQESE